MWGCRFFWQSRLQLLCFRYFKILSLISVFWPWLMLTSRLYYFILKINWHKWRKEQTIAVKGNKGWKHRHKKKRKLCRHRREVGEIWGSICSYLWLELELELWAQMVSPLVSWKPQALKRSRKLTLKLHLFSTFAIVGY